MNIEHLPVRYRVEFYRDSFRSDPVVALYGSSPFMTFQIGDFVDSRAWKDGALAPGQVYRVTGVEHIVYEIERSHITHSVGVRLEPAPESEMKLEA